MNTRLLVSLALFLIAGISPALAENAASKSRRGQPDFSNHETPLFGQVVERIREKVADRLGTETLTNDRYFMVPFAYENRGNDPAFSHSFITVIRVFARGKARKPHPEFVSGKFKNWEFEAYTISWLPADFPEHPDLCVFSGFGGRIFAKANRCPLSPGKSFDLRQTLRLAANAKVAVGMWGPYEIRKEGFDLGVKRLRLLATGKIKYRADDRLYRKQSVAINCFHAMASIEDPFPNGGAFGSGFKMWGLNGTSRVLIEYTTRASNKGLLLEPVNIKKDRYGFVYAPEDGKGRIYNPFKDASAYHH